jgi:hypothetical protein
MHITFKSEHEIFNILISAVSGYLSRYSDRPWDVWWGFDSRQEHVFTLYFKAS